MTSSLFPSLLSPNPSFWDFLAEGFDSMIFSYIGPPHATLTGHVLRLFKSQHEGHRRGGIIPPTDFTTHVSLHQRFIFTFISPILSSVDPGSPVSVPLPFIEQLHIQTQPKRSQKRIQESSLCLTSPVGLLHLNHILPNSLVIEIKPKWGFLPTCPLITNTVKHSVSKFQLMQRLKLKKGEITTFSDYNPPDLFSKSADSITRAFCSLIQNPQGNLKVFRNAKHSVLTANEIDPLVQHFIPGKSVLSQTMDQLLALQSLDIWDIECIEPILEKANRPNWIDLIGDQNVVEGVHKLLEERFRAPESVEVAKEMIEKMDQETARIHIAAFLIAQSAKDCSLMIVFQQEIRDVPQCFVIDFDLKLPELLLSNYLEADRKVVAAYLEWKEEVDVVSMSPPIIRFQSEANGFPERIVDQCDDVGFQEKFLELV
jgi:inositol-pentakisphosphate 2-kinase